MSALPDRAERLGPRLQGHWDARAAANFILGGAGGGLLLWSAALSLAGDVARLAVAVGLALVYLGLLCVWFEIGRPWRALNVFRHGSTAWMTREALVAMVLGGCSLPLLWQGGPTGLLRLVGLLGLAFAYSQARILTANKGIPAWREPALRPAVMASSLAEGAGLLALAAPWLAQPAVAAVLIALFTLARSFAWRAYLAALARKGAPVAALRALRAIDTGYLWGGGVAPVALATAAAMAGVPLLAMAAGALACAGGAWFKYTLVCRASYTQGFALPRFPVRGQVGPGQEPPAVKPGW